MGLRGIQEYIGRYANNIVSIKHRGQYILISPEKEPSNIIIIIHIGLCVSSYYREWLPAANLCVYKQLVRSARMRRVIIVGHYSGHILLPGNNNIIALLVTKPGQ